ncbi:sigma-70 family RNA polymerase sigma factor [Patescibacteria group bacterium]|jgi:RNA polymerase sigma-70 factor (ECF subfamily)|nr:sigma-70 family RNA polymerase sigma factor [Patescibacteria group bacterium]
MDEVSDRNLVARAREDPEAFGAIITRFEAPLRRYLRRITNVPHQDLDDLLQDTFLKAYQNLNAYDARFPLSSWMYRIARTTAISDWRKRTVRPTDYTLDDPESTWELADPGDLLEELARTHEAAEIPRGLGQIRPLYRDVLVLRFWEGKSYDEISDIIEKPPGTVATLIHRAKRALAEVLAEQR